jgi:hypothetical protein
MTTRKTAKKAAKRSPRTRTRTVANDAAAVIGGVAGIAAAAGAPWATAVAGLAAFLNNLPPDAVEAIDGMIRTRDSHAALMTVTEANAQRAAEYGFGEGASDGIGG